MRVVFFCGHRSLFGRQVLTALRKSRLMPEVLVLGTDTTWDRFDRKLNKQAIRGLRKRLRTAYFARKFKRWVEQDGCGNQR
jgi:hypothetical protein